MAKMSNKKKATRVYDIWKSSESHERVKWQSDSQKGFDFYLNEQLTRDEKDALHESGMPDFLINRITPIIEIMKYFVTANNPKWKAVGVEGSDANIGQVHSDIADYCWNLSNGQSVYASVTLDALTKGVGYFFVDIDKDADFGMGEVMFKRIDPYDIYPDPMSRDFLLRDAAYIVVKKHLTRENLMSMFPQFSSKVKKASEQPSITSYSKADRDSAEAIIPEDISSAINLSDGSKDDILGFYELYEKVRVPYMNLSIKVYPSKEDMEEMEVSIRKASEDFQKEVAVSVKEQILQIQQGLQGGEIIEERAKLEIEKIKEDAKLSIIRKDEELKYAAQEELSRVEQKVVTEAEYKILIQNEQMAETIVDAVKFYDSRIKVTCSIGSDVLLYEYVLPCMEYPIIPIPYMYTGTPYPMSAVTPMIGKQQEINKAHQVMLHNANLASNLRWLYEEGSVPEEEWEQYSSAPGALLKYRQGFTPPTPVLPAAINNAFYTVTQQGKGDMEYIAGIPSAMMGFVQEQSETYRGLLANDEFGTRRIKAWMNGILEPALEHLGRVFKETAQSHYKADKVFRIVQPNAGGGYSESEVRINIPIYNDYGEAIGKWSDYESARFDIRIVAGATMPLNRWALIEEYFKWFQAGLIDDIAMLAETDIRGKEKIVERKSLYSQLQQQVQELSESLKNKDGTIETLSRQVVQAGIRHNIEAGSMETKKDVLETEAQQKFYRKLLNEEMKTKDLTSKKKK